VIRPPTPATLRKYGLTAEAWREIVRSQGDRCPICLRAPPDVKLVCDHEHVKGFRAMPPEQRRQYVRTVACVWCNKIFLPRGITADKAERVAAVLRAYEGRKVKPAA
jgi:hypothetical protein